RDKENCFLQAEDGIRDRNVTGVQTCALPISLNSSSEEDVLICERIDNWVQLSGHEDSFALAGPGTIWKKRSSDSTEVQVYESLKIGRASCRERVERTGGLGYAKEKSNRKAAE